MSDPWSIKQGDSLPVLRERLTDQDPTRPRLRRSIVLTGATVVLHLGLDGSDTVALTKTATIVDAAGGIVEAAFTAVETAGLGVPAGKHYADYWREWQITFGDGSTLTVPNTVGPRGIRTVIERQIA